MLDRILILLGGLLLASALFFSCSEPPPGEEDSRTSPTAAATSPQGAIPAPRGERDDESGLAKGETAGRVELPSPPAPETLPEASVSTDRSGANPPPAPKSAAAGPTTVPARAKVTVEDVTTSAPTRGPESTRATNLKTAESAGEPASEAPEPVPPMPRPPSELVPPRASETPAVAGVSGGVIAVAGKPGALRIGADKCKMCHKAQHASWAESAHARQSPVLDCESCHGPGSEYKNMAVMKDPDRAREAGLVKPDKSFCTGSCHTEKWQDDMLDRTHAHKKEAP